MATSEPLRALSVRPNWAYCMLHLGKRIENRKWTTQHRGPLLIHAGKGLTRAEYEEVCGFCEEDGVRVPDKSEFLQGGLVAFCHVKDVIEAGDPGSDDIWFGGRYGFVLDRFKAIPFVPLKGQLGLFKVERSIVGM